MKLALAVVASWFIGAGYLVWKLCRAAALGDQ